MCPNQDLGKNPNLQPSPTRPANDGGGVVTPGSKVKTPRFGIQPINFLAFEKVVSDFNQQQHQLTDEEVAALMHNVQQAQKDLTEMLNRLSPYRKAIARVLESRRRAAAARRKAKGSDPGQVLPPAN